MKTTTSLSFTTRSAVIAVLCVLSFGVQAQTTAYPTTNTPDAAWDKLLQSLKIPSPLDEIVQLTKAGVGDPVIFTYIQNSTTAYNLSAQDIIKLREQGVSTEVTTALIQHGTEVRQAAQEAATTQTAATAPIAVVAPPVQPVSTVSVTYIGYPSERYVVGCYPSYVTFGTGNWCAPRVAMGFGYGGRQFGRYPSHARHYR